MSYTLGLYEKAMPQSLKMRDKLLLAKKCGFDFMEISIDETDEKLSRIFDKKAASDISDAVRAAGLPVLTMCLSAHRKYPLGGENEKCLDIMKAATEFAQAVGIRIIQLAGYDVYYEESTEKTRERFGINLKRCVDGAKCAGVMLGFETMETDFMNTVAKAMKYVSMINSPYLQIYPDIGNIRNATDDYLSDIDTGRGHIAAAHLKETKPGIYRELEYGQGRVDFEGCVAALMRQGVGIYNCEFWYDGKTEPYEYIMRNKSYVEKILARYR